MALLIIVILAIIVLAIGIPLVMVTKVYDESFLQDAVRAAAALIRGPRD